jgi:signal transduction histidine kinase
MSTSLRPARTARGPGAVVRRRTPVVHKSRRFEDILGILIAAEGGSGSWLISVKRLAGLSPPSIRDSLLMRLTVNSLVGRLAVLQLLVYAALLPVLFYRLDAANQANAIETFTQHARAYTRSLARELELGDVLKSASRTVAFLDGGVEGGGAVYAAVEYNGRLVGSSVAETPAWVERRGDDIAFSKSTDSLYAVAAPIKRGDVAGVLYLGFDKRPTLDQLRTGRNAILVALIAYGVASLVVAVLLARLVSKPLTQLRTASRQVAQGNSAAHLATNSRMIEIIDLSRDLELMRTELVGAAERLRAEIEQRQIEHAERTALESQLRHEQRLATIGTFAGGLAHEFNNILVPLILYTEDSLEEIGPEHPVRANLERVLAAATRAGNVVSKLLEFSRPVVARQPEPVELAAVTDEALDLSQALIPPNIELRREIGAKGQCIIGDATLLSQVVLNLCSNAVQAMRQSGGTITVTVATKLAGKSLPSGAPRIIELRVKDTGHGMSPETQERVFEPFFTTREVGEGTGLGLAIVHGIVASMGGRISVISALGAGAEFVVELPALEQA